MIPRQPCLLDPIQNLRICRIRLKPDFHLRPRRQPRRLHDILQAFENLHPERAIRRVGERSGIHDGIVGRVCGFEADGALGHRGGDGGREGHVAAVGFLRTVRCCEPFDFGLVGGEGGEVLQCAAVEGGAVGFGEFFECWCGLSYYLMQEGGS